jgi:hypothetical protein
MHETSTGWKRILLTTPKVSITAACLVDSHRTITRASVVLVFGTGGIGESHDTVQSQPGF